MHAAKLTLTRAKLNAKGVVTPIRLYLNADRSKVVGEGKDAAVLLAAAGSEIPESDVKRYGIQGLIDEANKTIAAENEAKAKAEADAKAAAEAEAKAAAEVEAKAKAAADEAYAKAKADAEGKGKTTAHGHGHGKK